MSYKAEKEVTVYAHFGCDVGLAKGQIVSCDCDKGIYIQLEDGSVEYSKWCFIGLNKNNLPSTSDGYLDFDKCRTLNHNQVHKLIMNRKDYHSWEKKGRKFKNVEYVVLNNKLKDEKVFSNFQKAKRFMRSNLKNGFNKLTMNVETQYKSSWNCGCIEYEDNTVFYGGKFKESQIKDLL